MLKSLYDKIICKFNKHDLIFISGPHYFVKDNIVHRYNVYSCYHCNKEFHVVENLQSRKTNTYQKVEGE